MCLLRMLVATDQVLRTQLCFLHLSSVRNDLEHTICALRVHRSREPPPHPINGWRLTLQGDSLIPRHMVISVCHLGVDVHSVYW